MSLPRKSTTALELPVATDGVAAPLLGALVRLFYEAFRTRLVMALQANGFADITQTEIMLFQETGPDGARPIELAQRCHMSKQAMNYVLTHMERSGYLERRGGDAGDNRLVHLTRRGWKLYNLLRKTIDAMHADWAAKIGRRRFDATLEVLQEIVLDEEAKRGAEPPAALPRRGRRIGAARPLKRAS